MDQIGIETMLANIAQVKFEDEPYFMYVMDEETALELIAMGE